MDLVVCILSSANDVRRLWNTGVQKTVSVRNWCVIELSKY